MKPASPQELLGRELNDIEARYAPGRLWSEGDLGLLAPGVVRVSIVGSRSASPEGLKRARKVARIVVGEGVVVVSGLARGIDAAAHTETLAAGGRTIAVVGTGLDRFYPPENRGLQERIAAEHLVLSQFPPGTPPARGNFPQRNRTMALLSDATVIVEAGETSGSLSQAWEALRLARPLFLLRSLVESDLAWPRGLLDHGARVLDSAGALFEAIPSPFPTAAVAF